MTQRTRKLLGTIPLVASVVLYAALATWAYETLFVGWPWYALIIYFCVAGLGWFYPAAAIVRWMSRPDE